MAVALRGCGTSFSPVATSGNLKPSKLGNFSHGQMQSWVGWFPSLLGMFFFTTSRDYSIFLDADPVHVAVTRSILHGYFNPN